MQEFCDLWGASVKQALGMVVLVRALFALNGFVKNSKF